MTEANPGRREKVRARLVACAILSALSLTLPAGLYLFAVMNAARASSATSVMVVVAAAAVGILYAAIVLAARDSGAAIIAGVSTTLAVLGVLVLIPILLLAKLDAMFGGTWSSGGLVLGAVVYVATQCGIASEARTLAGTEGGRKLRASAGFQCGVALPLVFAFLLSGASGIPHNAEMKTLMTTIDAREKTRSDLFALWACATAHRALAPNHDYPSSLSALGSNGDKCAPAAVASGERGWTFEYTPRMSGADTVAGFTIRAKPRAGGENATMLTMDEHAIIQQDWLNGSYAPLYRPSPPGLDMLVAMRDCEQLYRNYRHEAPSDLGTLRAFGDSTLNSVNAPGCWTLRNVKDRLEWAEYGQPRMLNEWSGSDYALTFHPGYGGDRNVVAYEVRPKTFGVTGVWSYLAVSPGAMYGTTEPRAATTADVAIPVCEFGAPPAGSPQCIPGNSPPPNARLVVDPVPDARGFTVALVGARDSTGESTPDTTTENRAMGAPTEFQYAFSCDGTENDAFVKEASHICHADWRTDSARVRARIRNRDLTMREYARWVHPKQPPLAMRIAAPKRIVLGEPLDLQATAAGRDSSERFELTVHIGDAFPMVRSNWRNGETVHCGATTNPSSWECSYPAKPGKYRLTLTAKGWRGDTASVTTSVVVTTPK